MLLEEAIDLLRPAARSSELTSYATAVETVLAAVERAQALADVKKVIHDRRVIWNEDRSVPVDVVLAAAVVEYVKGKEQ